MGASVAVNNTTPITMATDDVVFMWMFFAVGSGKPFKILQQVIKILNKTKS